MISNLKNHLTIEELVNMKIFAISDLHLSGSDPKPMDIFGSQWEDHFSKIKRNWREQVRDEDVVLIPGDISWAMTLEDAMIDLKGIADLPGKKIMIRGNHDYWWSSISKVRRALPKNMIALQNDNVKVGEIAFCGSRGWTAPGAKDYTLHDLKIFKREVQRLKLSLKSVKDSNYIIVILHYPPFNFQGELTEIIEVLMDYPVRHVVFGHLHGESLKGVTEGIINGINYHLVSCDYLDYKLKPLCI